MEIKKYNNERITAKYEEFTAEYTVNQKAADNMPLYGITVDCGKYGSDSLENIFFTEEEAYRRCEWLAENEVFTQGFRDVMSEIIV